MDLAIFRRLTVDRQAKLFHHTAQLGVDVLPLAHAQIVKKIDPALAAELIRRQRLLLLAEVVPQIDEGEEIGLFIVEAAMFSSEACCLSIGRSRGSESTARR